MPIGRTRMVRDYNRGLAWPVRIAHVVYSVAAIPLHPLWRWASTSSRAWWARPLVASLLLFAILLPLDGLIASIARNAPIEGDVRRVTGWLGEYGQGGMALLLITLVWILDRAHARRLLDYLFAVLLAAMVTLPLKMLIGRPRPRPDMLETYNHLDFLGPFGAHPFGPEIGVRHAWEFWADISANLWSMPSSHTVYAVVMSVWIAAMYPQLRSLAWTLAGIVGLARIAFGAHYPTDVLIGAALGYLIASPCVHRCWGVRFLDWLWAFGLEPGAPPAPDRLAEARAAKPHSNETALRQMG